MRLVEALRNGQLGDWNVDGLALCVECLGLSTYLLVGVGVCVRVRQLQPIQFFLKCGFGKLWHLGELAPRCFGALVALAPWSMLWRLGALASWSLPQSPPRHALTQQQRTLVAELGHFLNLDTGNHVGMDFQNRINVF